MNRIYLEIVRMAKKKDLFKKPNRNSAVSSLIAKFDLKPEEAKLFIAIFGECLDGPYLKLKDLQRSYELSEKEYLCLLTQARNLQQKGMIVFETGRNGKMCLINPEIRIDESVFNYLISGEDLFSGCNFKDTYSITDLACKLIGHRENQTIVYEKFLKEINRLYDSIDNEIPLHNILAGLTNVERTFLFKAILNYISGEGSSYFSSFAEKIFPTLIDRARFIRSVRELDLKIIKNNLISIEGSGDYRSDPQFTLSEKAVRFLFPVGAKKKNRKPEFESDLLTYLEHEKLERTLFLNHREKEIMETLGNAISVKNFANLKKSLKCSNFPSGLIAMFWGNPGTGKTASVYDLAFKTGRDIFQVDISNIKDCWVGTSEKNMRKVFRDYKVAKEELNLEPILLFNEADALLGRRIRVEHSVDQMNNSMKNILLEELENFDGIFIATTNLIDNLDEAFSRRFLFKIEFKLPSREARFNIWKDKLPRFSKSDYQRLSEYELNGAQIENIARRHKIDSVIHFSKTHSWDLNKNILEELNFKGRQSKRPIGFVE